MAERYVFRPRDFLRDQLMSSVERSISFDIPEESFFHIRRHTSQGEIPIIVSNHQSHLDAVVHALMADKILKTHAYPALRGFYLPYAASVTTGDQGKNINKFFYFLNDWFKERGVFPIPVTRKKDTEQYDIQESNFRSLLALKHAARDHFGVAILPEGTIKGGRKKADGAINGMVYPKDEGIDRLFLSPEYFFVPLSIDGTYRIFGPDSKFPTQEAIASVLGNVFTHHEKPMATVKVGDPITQEDIRQHPESTATNFILRTIAQNLPPPARGVYMSDETFITARKLELLER